MVIVIVTSNGGKNKLDLAIQYAERGWRVIQSHIVTRGVCSCGDACPSPGKHPIEKNWPRLASADVDAIRRAWLAKSWPNVGIVAGQASDLLILDVDPRNGGDETLKGWLAIHALPRTPVVRTGGGGWHYYFKWVPGLKNGPIGPGVDLKVDGGFVVAPPSRHPSGDLYSWENDTLALPVAPAPEWLLEIARGKSQVIAGNQRQSAAGSKILEGVRNKTLTRYAGAMRRVGMTSDEICVALLTANQRCGPPLPDPEIEKIALSICRYDSGGGDGLDVICYNDVTPRRVEFLWTPYLPIGKLSILEGDPGAGKTFIALAIAAAITKGLPLPHCREGASRAPQNVVYMSREDGLADSLVPRSIAAGADRTRIFAVEGVRRRGVVNTFSFKDLDLLEDVVAHKQPGLVVVDPLQSFFGAGVDLHRSNETRPLLDQLGKMAERHRCAVLILRHLAKAGARNALYQGLGSIDIIGAARSAMLAGIDPKGQDRVLVQTKSSCSASGPAISYSLSDAGLAWGGISEVTADDLLRANVHQDCPSKFEQAAGWLTDFLQNGPVEVQVVQAQALAQGISKRTLDRAKKSLDVQSVRKGFISPWEWELPS